MYFIIISLFFISKAVYCKQMYYNNRYCISKPHYLMLTGPIHMPPSPPKPELEVDYKIPKSIKKMFLQNIPYKNRQD